MRSRLLVLVFLCSLTAAAQRRDGACAYGIDAPRVYAAAEYSRVFSVDFDGNGRLDVGTAGAKEFQVRYGLGLGALSEARTFALKVIDVGDLTGDALPDLLLDRFSVAENRGGDTFAAPRPIEGAGGTHLLGDFTGDGKGDLLFLSAAKNVLTLHARSGDALVPREPQYLPERMRTMAVANVNGDALHDLLLLHEAGRVISVWRGTAGGAFEYVESFTPGGVATDLVAADLDGDGRTETIASVQDHLELFYGNGGRVERIAPSTPGPLHVEVHDFNGDGASDLLVDAAIFINESGLLREASRGIYAYRYAPLTAGEFTGDRAAELVVPTGSGYAIVTPFTQRPLRPLPDLVQGYGHVIVDMNGDGLDDLVFGRDRSVHVAINDGAGGFALETLPMQFRRAIFSATPEEITVIDENNIPRTVDVFRRGTDGAWQLTRTVVAAPEAIAARTADLDGDGATETIVIENNLLSGPIPFPNDYRLKIFSGRTGALLREQEHGTHKIELEVDDLNADGVADLLMAVRGVEPSAMGPRQPAFRYGVVQVLYGVRGGTPGEPVTVAIRTIPRAPRTGDFNGDGRRDLAYLDDWALVAHYGTAGGFTAGEAVATPGPYASLLAAADLNGDAITDLLAHGWAEATLVAGSHEGLVRIGTFYGAFGVPMRLRANRPPSRVVTGNAIAELDGVCRSPRRRVVRH